MTKAKVLHERALIVVKTYLSSEAELIEILKEMDETKGYRELGCAKLKEYAMRLLGLSENPAETLIRIAHKSIEVPRLLELIREGSLSMSNARLLLPILTPENQDRWLLAACHLSKRELEMAIVSENPDRLIQEKLKQVSRTLWELRVGMSHTQAEKAKRVQDLEASRKSTPVNLAQTFEAAFDVYLDRHDPIRKAERAQKRKARQEKSEEKPKEKPKATERPASRDGKFQRQKLRAPVRHELALRDKEQCSRILPDGSRCPERRWLHRHHEIRWADGGPDTAMNLTTHCFACHALLHEQEKRTTTASRDANSALFERR